MVVHDRPQTPKNTSFLGDTQPPGVAHILGDTTRPRHVTCVLVWSKSDRRRLRKTLHKQTDKQTDTTKIMVTWPWTKNPGTLKMTNRGISKCRSTWAEDSSLCRLSISGARSLKSRTLRSSSCGAVSPSALLALDSESVLRCKRLISSSFSITCTTYRLQFTLLQSAHVEN